MIPKALTRRQFLLRQVADATGCPLPTIRLWINRDIPGFKIPRETREMPYQLTAVEVATLAVLWRCTRVGLTPGWVTEHVSNVRDHLAGMFEIIDMAREDLAPGEDPEYPPALGTRRLVIYFDPTRTDDGATGFKMVSGERDSWDQLRPTTAVVVELDAIILDTLARLDLLDEVPEPIRQRQRTSELLPELARETGH